MDRCKLDTGSDQVHGCSKICNHDRVPLPSGHSTVLVSHRRPRCRVCRQSDQRLIRQREGCCTIFCTVRIATVQANGPFASFRCLTCTTKATDRTHGAGGRAQPWRQKPEDWCTCGLQALCILVCKTGAAEVRRRSAPLSCCSMLLARALCPASAANPTPAPPPRSSSCSCDLAGLHSSVLSRLYLVVYPYPSPSGQSYTSACAYP